jgi:A/G-specific adenine glycosylase
MDTISSSDVVLIRQALTQWYLAEKRDLPWRSTKSPYGTWISEIMSQQTRIEAVVPYWLKWMEKFPSIEALANAEEVDVLNLWAGLGFYRRAKLLHQGAKFVV